MKYVFHHRIEKFILNSYTQIMGGPSLIPKLGNPLSTEKPI